MFATLARRWRIATPIVAAVMAASIAIVGFIAPASAHNLHFRFSGDAADFINYTVNPAYFDCFSGYLDPAGGSNIKSGLRDCIVPGFDYNHVEVSGTVGAWEVTADHNGKEGHALSSMELAGFNTGNFSGGGHPHSCTFPCAANLNNDSVYVAWCLHEFCNGDTVENNKVQNPDGTCSPADCNGNKKILVSSRDILEESEAECQKHGNGGQADARSQASFTDLFVRHSGGNSFDTVASAEGFGSVVITRTFSFTVPVLSVDSVVTGTKTQILTLIVTTNDHTVFQSGNHAAISGNGLRVIVQDGEGDIMADVVAAHTHADIECSTKSFHFEDPIGA